MIELQRYDNNWKYVFILEKSIISTLLSDNVKVIEHVGSTAIPFQYSKPIIDMFVGVNPLFSKEHYSSILDDNIYKYINTGMSKRYLFEKYSNNQWSHNIHILPYNEEFYQRNEILFRDYLIKHNKYIEEYSELKMKISNLNPEEYTKAKTNFIQKIVDLARTERGLPIINVWE